MYIYIYIYIRREFAAKILWDCSSRRRDATASSSQAHSHTKRHAHTPTHTHPLTHSLSHTYTYTHRQQIRGYCIRIVKNKFMKSNKNRLTVKFKEWKLAVRTKWTSILLLRYCWQMPAPIYYVRYASFNCVTWLIHACPCEQQKSTRGKHKRLSATARTNLLRARVCVCYVCVCVFACVCVFECLCVSDIPEGLCDVTNF